MDSWKRWLLLAGLVFGLMRFTDASAACSMRFSRTSYPAGDSVWTQATCSTLESARAACTKYTEDLNVLDYCTGASGQGYEGYVAGWLYPPVPEGQRWEHHFGTFFRYGDGPPPNAADNAGAPPCAGQCFGDPINAGTGNKYQIKTEYKGQGALPLEFTWTYNSQSAPDFLRPEAKTLGRNRTHTYSGVLDYLDLVHSPVVQVSRPDGKVLRFSASAQGWVADAHSAGRLKQNVEADVTTGWEFDDGDGRYESFDASGRLVSIHDLSGHRLAMSYDGGSLRSVTDSSGRSLLFSYDAEGRIDRIVQPDGGYVAFAYGSGSDLARVEYSDGSAIQYRYDEPELAASGAYPGMLTGIIDENQDRYSSTTYDSSSAATSTYLGDHQDLHSATYARHSSAVVTLPNGAVRSLTFDDPAGVVVTTGQETACAGCATHAAGYTYDANGRVDVATVAGVSTDYDYDARGLLWRKVEAANDTTGNRRTTETDWHSVYPLPVERRIRDSAGVVVAQWSWAYNTRGQLLESRQIDPVNPADYRSIKTQYCEQSDVAANLCPLIGLPKSVDGPRTDLSDITAYSYYQNDDVACATSPTTCAYRKGDLRAKINALGQTVAEYLRYDGSGRVLLSKDANGVVIDLEYTPRGWLSARKVRGADPNSESDDSITRYEYDLVGQVKKVVQPDGSHVRYEYDSAHRLIDIVDMAGNRIHYTLDVAGNRIKEDIKDAGGELKRTLSRIYNQLGQLQTTKTAEGHANGYTYDADGNADVATDALGRKTDSDYDPLGRLAKTLQDVGGINAKTEFKYDAQDRLVRVTDPKNLNTDYGYNGFGDQVRLSSPDTGLSTFTYDSAGNRKTATDARGITQTYSYDAINRVTGVGYPTSSLNIAYVYDSVPTVCATGETFTQGRLTLMTDGSGSTQYCYDRFGNTVRKVQTTNGKVFTLRYGYTLAGQLRSLTYPDGAVVTYQRDPQGRIVRIDAKSGGTGGTNEVLLSQAGYHAFGPVAGWTYGNGRTMSRPVDLDYRTVAVHDPAPGGLSVGFGFDAVGNIEKLTSAGAENPVLIYDYDALNRLIRLRDGPSGAAIESYAYDATGNRLSFANAAVSQSYVYPADSHRLTQAGPNSPRSYDLSGNSIQIGDKSFTYNDAGRSSTLAQGSNLLQTYAYNGRGEQVLQYGGTSVRHFVHVGIGQWLGEYGNNGEAVRQVIWMDDLPIGLWSAEGAQQTLRYVEPDHLGTPRVVLDPVRNLAVWTWDLKGEAFGMGQPNDDADSDRIRFVFDMRFPGQRYDDVSGLNQNYFRNYDSPVGRYTAADPKGQFGDMALYAYAASRPNLYVDPDGREPIPSGCDGANGITLCDGNGGFEVRVCNRGCSKECTRVHEERHVQFFKARAPNRCRGKLKGDNPTLSRDSSEPYFWYESECRAISAGKKCAQDFRGFRCLGAECDLDIKDYIRGADYYRERYKCESYGW